MASFGEGPSTGTRAAARKRQRTADDSDNAARAEEREKRTALAAPAASPGIDDLYVRLDEIGRGVYGVVYRAMDRRTREIVAMKCLFPARNSGDDVEAVFAREVRALEACRGLPSVVQLRCSGRRGREAVIVMEFVGPSLWSLIRDDDGPAGATKRYAEPEARRSMRQLLAGAAGMHRRGLMHRDIKPDNVLVDGAGGLKLCDLGMARGVCGEPPYSTPVMALRYRAPEVLLGWTEYDALVDAWGLGCVMAELLAGEHPYLGGQDGEEQLARVLDVLGTDDIKSWRGYDGSPLPRGCGPRSILRDRFPCPGVARITGRPALSEDGFAVLSGLLRCNPDKRMTAARALQHRWFKDN